MAKFCVIENGKVVNIIVADSQLNQEWVPYQAGVNIGWSWDGTQFEDETAQLSLAEAKAIAIDRLEIDYSERLGAATIGGMNVDKILPYVVKADMVIAAGGTNLAAVYKGQSQLLNAAKLTAIKTYWSNCSDAAKTHFAAIQNLASKAAVKNYIQTNLQTGWPSEAL